jgi:hypothetical protein
MSNTLRPAAFLWPCLYATFLCFSSAAEAHGGVGAGIGAARAIGYMFVVMIGAVAAVSLILAHGYQRKHPGAKRGVFLVALPAIAYAVLTFFALLIPKSDFDLGSLSVVCASLATWTGLIFLVSKTKWVRSITVGILLVVAFIVGTSVNPAFHEYSERQAQKRGR